MVTEKAPKKRAAYGLPADVDAVVEAAQDAQRIMAKHIRPDGSYKPQGILALLKANRVNVTALAGTYGCSETYFRQVIARDCKDVDIEDLIADKLGIVVPEKKDRMWGRRMLEVANAC